MLRTSLGPLPQTLRRAKSPQLAAWEQTWRRLFTSQTTAQSLRQASHRIQFVLPNGLPTATRRFGTGSRPGFGSSQTAFRGTQKRGFRFSPWRRNQGTGAGGQENLSMTEKLRKLSREYGRAAIAVYFMLSILDYPFFFLLVKAVGTERVAVVEHYIVSAITSVVPESIRNKAKDLWQSIRSKDTEITGDGHITEKAETVGRWGVEEAQERHAEEASLATQLALAYAIHKTFVFVRIPLTVAVTPRIVKQLRAWGWNIGKKIVRRR